MQTELVRIFKNINKHDAALAGGKGASLGEMAQAGIPVPPGFVILSATFEKFLDETDLNVEVAAILKTVDHKAMHTVENASEKIQSLILAAEMPGCIAEEIEKYFKTLDARFVAVRSSATAEDSASAAWAGQLNSYLNTSKKDLLLNVKKCWASLFTPRAIFYRFEKGLERQKISVAVVVQKMVASEISGIAFSVHPVTEDKNQLIIEAGYGLGESIVGGEITPDSYVVGKEPREILDININTQTRGLYRAKSGGNEWRTISEPQASSQVLDEGQILELSELILKIENHYEFPCDIEWAFEKGEFFIVQSRPITTLSNKATRPEDDAILESIKNTDFRKEISYSFIPVICFESAMRSYSSNLIRRKLKIEKMPNVIEILTDNFESWDDGSIQKISNKKQIEYLIKESYQIIVRHSETIDKLLKNDFRKMTKSGLAKTLKMLDKICEETYQRYLFFIHEFFETDDVYLLKQLPEVRMRLSDFVGNIYKCCDKLIEALSIRFNEIPWRAFTFATFEEIVNLLENDQDELKFREIENRPIVFIFMDEMLSIVTQEDRVRKIITSLKSKKQEFAGKEIISIHGASVYSGKVRGEVIKVSEHEYGKIKDILKNKIGYILVTPMTRPEFVPFLKNAIAIVTDEGGITCHAAIVSRELKKPCIVGTKIATQVLKDGDEVEVDADNGVVRILKKKK